MPDRDLPDDLVLPLTSGEPWWYWTGGRPAVDFVNTHRERWRRNVETLVTPSDLTRWLVRAGVMDADGGAAVSAKVLGQARDLRDAIDALVVAAIEGGPAPADAITLVDDWLVFAGARPQLVAGPDGVPALTERAAADSPRRALGMVALDAAQMLGTARQRDRIRICASETCSGRFFDRSPGGGRRWCSMRTCGNEAKARRHRLRQKAQAPEPPGDGLDRLRQKAQATPEPSGDGLDRARHGADAQPSTTTSEPEMR
ncbi:MAG TPA: ABATE domain-containing protein [Baekduia sp.]|uniref:CGNR zinc finger domain-containing protein n=1 Tax=Baekduia sp. TaxID=2600305 RepID=UPI002D76D85B|nr:ABATE domain-containing protein [Baekduia sp.]HET6509730.1 ABATE domain-containing protein [Baekduia sp.]